MRTFITALFLSFLMLPAQALSAERGLIIKGVRYFSYTAFTRIVFEVEAAAPYVLTKAEDGKSLMLTAYEGPLTLKSELPAIRDGVVSGLEAKGGDEGKTFLSIRLDMLAGEVKDFVLHGPDRIVLDITRGMPPATPKTEGKQAVVVLDPGHGGKDTGVVTAQGPEKTITLDIAKAIRKIIEKNPRMKVILTREKDQVLTLEERAAAANAAGATLFVSIHTSTGLGSRVYMADLENDSGAAIARPAAKGFLSFDVGSGQQEMLWGRQQAAHVKESGALGRSLVKHLGGKDGVGPVQAPLAVLKAVNAAAVLVEAGAGLDRTKSAEAIAKGIEQYARENR